MRLFFLLILSIIPLYGYSDNSFLNNKTVTGCEGADGFPPLIYENTKTKKLNGYTVDLLNLMFENTGAKFDPFLIPWQRCLNYGKEGKEVDIVLNSALNSDRIANYIHSKAFAKITPSFFYDKQRFPNGLDITSKKDLDKYIMCGKRGYNYEQFELGDRDIDMTASKWKQVIKKVVIKRCDLLLSRHEIYKGILLSGEKPKYYDRLEGMVIPWRKGRPQEFHFLVNKKSEFHRQLIEFIDEQLVVLKNNGELQKLLDKYKFVSKF